MPTARTRFLRELELEVVAQQQAERACALRVAVLGAMGLSGPETASRLDIPVAEVRRGQDLLRRSLRRAGRAPGTGRAPHIKLPPPG